MLPIIVSWSGATLPSHLTWLLWRSTKTYWKHNHHTHTFARAHLLVHRSTQHIQMNRSRQILQCCWHTFLGSCRAVKYSCWWLQKDETDFISDVAMFITATETCTIVCMHARYKPLCPVVGSFLSAKNSYVDQTEKLVLMQQAALKKKVCQADWNLLQSFTLLKQKWQYHNLHTVCCQVSFPVDGELKSMISGQESTDENVN